LEGAQRWQAKNSEWLAKYGKELTDGRLRVVNGSLDIVWSYKRRLASCCWLRAMIKMVGTQLGMLLVNDGMQKMLVRNDRLSGIWADRYQNGKEKRCQYGTGMNQHRHFYHKSTASVRHRHSGIGWSVWYRWSGDNPALPSYVYETVLNTYNFKPKKTELVWKKISPIPYYLSSFFAILQRRTL
jgi:hypothetical protein